MQVKQETTITNSLSSDQPLCQTPTSEPKLTRAGPHEMRCQANTGSTTSHDNSSPYSLWAEYFDNFPIVTEFDLRTSAAAAGSTGSSIASSSSPSDNWSSPGSGSPFSDCDQDDAAFLDEHSVPNSIIDEIVQTLKMDGYNFDHLGEGIIENSNSFPIKQEHEQPTQPCLSQAPVYACLNPAKNEVYLKQDIFSEGGRKYHSSSSISLANNNTVGLVNNIEVNNLFDDSTSDSKWCNTNGSLPPMSISLQQIQQHSAHLQQPLIASISGQPSLTNQPPLPPLHQALQDPHQLSYATPLADSNTNQSHFSPPLFPGSYNPLPVGSTSDSNNIQQYKYVSNQPVTLQQLPLLQTCEKSTETKPRRRRTTNSSSRIEKPHLCNECGAAFKLSANLKQHQVIHTGEKPFSCDICKAMFTRLSSLKTHHRLHTGEKPHICPYCGAAFADRSAMKAHKRIHTGERPYKCGVCQTSFTQLSHLNAHKRTHTGEKPYACAICGTTFKQLGHLKRHEKSHVCSRI